MNKFDVLAITGKMEVKFKDNERFLSEIANLQKFISEDDFFNSAISFGRLCEILNISEISENKDIQAIYEYISIEKNFQKVSEDEIMNLNIRDLEFSTRTYNILRRAGICTVEDILSEGKGSIKNCHSAGKKTIDEIDSKLKQLGLKLK